MDSVKESGLSRKAIIYMILLAFQFGFQPILSKQFTPTNISRSSVILIQEFLKFAMALSMLKISGSMKKAVSGKLVMKTRAFTWANGNGYDLLTPSYHSVSKRLEYQNLAERCLCPGSTVRCSEHCCTPSVSKSRFVDVQCLEPNEDAFGCSFLLPCNGTTAERCTSV